MPTSPTANAPAGSEPAEPTANGPSAAEVWSRYAGEANHFDEAVQGASHPRGHWQRVVDAMGGYPAAQVDKRWAASRRVLSENGVTYNIHAEGEAVERSWKLDAVPMVIPHEEWSKIEAGLLQRARMLNLVLEDLYGPRKLLADGFIPPAMLWANPRFLRPMHNAITAAGPPVVIYAADLGRSADGRWWVISDRTQAPSGTGYALENRIVISRTWPTLFRDMQAQRLASFFAGMRDALRRMAPLHKDDPGIVMLTPGPYAETYFEHAYLARYLGLPLVEGRDLTVRNQRVFMKTLSGLVPVDVIVRRMDDDYCDPLELREDSALGITGLVRAARAGNVAIANALGTGVVDAAGMMPFYPGLCRRLLGEEERLPSVATWWCGQQRERRYVIDNLEKLVIKPAFRDQNVEPVFGGSLSEQARDALIKQIEGNPHLYVGQEWLPLSTAPVWQDASLSARRVMVRVFVSADGEGGYRVMPGGLTRVASAADRRIVTMQRGGGSKDTWVLSDKPVPRTTLLPRADGAVAIVRGGINLSSRVAEDLYWLGRYVDRVDGLARLVREVTRFTLEENDGEEMPALLEALKTVTFQTESELDETELIRTILTDREDAVGLWHNVTQARRLSGSVRDVISGDVWRVVSRLERQARVVATTAEDPVALLANLDALLSTVAAFVGFGADSMTRGQGYWFLEMGRRVERAMFLTRLFRAMLVDDPPQPQLLALLRIGDSIMTYRSRYRTMVSAVAVVDLLLNDETNPRSLAFQLVELAKQIDQLPRDAGNARRSEEERLVLAMLTELRLADAEMLVSRPTEQPTPTRPVLRDVLAMLSERLPRVSDAISLHYLSHAQPPSQLTDRGGTDEPISTRDEGEASALPPAKGDPDAVRNASTGGEL